MKESAWLTKHDLITYFNSASQKDLIWVVAKSVDAVIAKKGSKKAVSQDPIFGTMKCNQFDTVNGKVVKGGDAVPDIIGWSLTHV